MTNKEKAMHHFEVEEIHDVQFIIVISFILQTKTVKNCMY